MTFEEFLTKKKIDLVQLETAEPAFFLEFKSHFNQMGEKSFDHSKKFWFNKLRRAYHLKEEPKITPAKETIEINELASQAEPLLSPTVEATVYTPRFKSKPTIDENRVGALGSEAKDDKPAYKPKFKMPATGASIPSEISPDVVTTPEQNKPAYTPRFKAPVAKEAQESSEEIKSPADQPRPAFKPRFKAAITASATEVPSPEEPKTNSVPEISTKPAYVPRFKAQIAAQEEQKTEKPEGSKENDDAVEQVKPVYKPRFKSAMVKPKDSEE